MGDDSGIKLGGIAEQIPDDEHEPDGLWAGRNPIFTPADFMQHEINIQDPAYCRTWIRNYCLTGGQVELPKGKRMSDMPDQYVTALVERVSAGCCYRMIGSQGGLV
jgi:hypothetical protein